MSVNNLVKSLSKAEKRYFKLYSSLNSKNKTPKYVKLFNVIDKKSNISDSELKALGYSPVHKNFLGNKILECLQSFYYNNDISPEKKVHQILEGLPILYQKELYSEMNKHLKQIKKICTQNELLELQLILFDWEKKLAEFSFIDKSYYEEVMKLESVVLQQLRYKRYLFNIKERINALIRKDVKLSKPENKAAFDEIFATEQLPSEEELTSIEALLTYYFIQSTRYIYQRDHKKTMMYSAKLVDLFEKHDNFKNKHTIWYKKSLCKHLDSCFNARNYEDFPKTLEKIKNLEDNSSEMDAEIFKTVPFNALLYNIQMGLLDEAELVVKDIEKDWEQYKEHIEERRQLAIFYNCAVLFLVREKWTESLKWFEKITNFPRTNMRKDIQLTTRIILLILTYELDPSELDKTIQTAYKYLTRNEHYFEFEKSVIALFRKLEKNIGLSSSKRKSIFVDFKEEVKVVRQLGFEELELWVASKINGKSLEQTYLDLIQK